jgi:photosystem II stability/assembly factor-like uncharacterized protein
VGNNSGAMYYTLDGGENWVQVNLPGATPTKITDIKAATQEVIHVAYIQSALARLASSLNGGVSWVTSDNVNPRLIGIPTTGNQEYHRIATPA